MPIPPTTQIDPIKIFYPNGGNEASQMYIWDGTKPVLWTGSVTFSGTISLGAISGTLTNNNAAPAANNVGVLPAVVSTTALGYTQGNQALLRVDTTGALVISGTVTSTISNTTMTVVQATASNLNAQVVGNVASSTTDSGNPIKIGYKASSYGTNPVAATNGQRTDAYANVAGIPFIVHGHPNIITRLDNFTSSTTNSALISVSGGTKIVVMNCTIAADSANTVKPSARAGFGTTNTPSTSGVYISHPGIPAGGGIRQAGMVAGADGDDFRFTCAVPTGGSLDVVTQYFTIES